MRWSRTQQQGQTYPLAEHRLVSFRPVDLVEIDVIGLQAAQRRCGAERGCWPVGASGADARSVKGPVRAGLPGGDVMQSQGLAPASRPAVVVCRKSRPEGAQRTSQRYDGVVPWARTRSQLGVGVVCLGSLPAEGHGAQARSGTSSGLVVPRGG